MGNANHHEKDPVGWPPVPGSGEGRRILFINPPSIPYNALIKTFNKQSAPLHQTVSMPMGILYLASTLERDLPGIAIDIADIAKSYREMCDRGVIEQASFEEFCGIALRAAAQDTPDVIGISVLFSTAHKSTLRIAEVCKAIWPDVPVVVGGMHATNSVKSLLENPAIDYVCRGEGESIIAKLAMNPHADIQGIIGRQNARAPASAPLIYNLDTIPHPAWHLIPMDEYIFSAQSRAKTLDRIEQDGAATIVTTRGCPFHCTFCASWTVHGREMRFRSTENVLEELRTLTARYGVNTLIPEDDLFSVKKPRFIELCNSVADEFGDSLSFQFPNGLSVATLDADVLTAMKRMGMTVANIAIESGSDYVQRKIIKKNVDLDRARRVIADCRKLDLYTRAYFIVGFPGETREQMQETSDFAASLDADWVIVGPAAPLAGTEMYDQMIARGDIDGEFNWDEAFFNERNFDTPEIGAQELKDIAYLMNLRLNFFENYNLKTGQFVKAEQLFHDILRAHPDHLAAQLCLVKSLRGQGRTAEAEDALGEAHIMIARGDRLAVEQATRYPDLFVGFAVGGSAGLSAKWPRGGMPTAAREHL